MKEKTTSKFAAHSAEETQHEREEKRKTFLRAQSEKRVIEADAKCYPQRRRFLQELIALSSTRWRLLLIFGSEEMKP